MTSFEAGFIKFAEESGLSAEQAAHIFKRAMEYSGSQDIFKQLPDEQPSETAPEDYEVLANLLQQELIDKNMSAATQQIKL